MSELKVNAVVASTGTNTNLTLDGKGTGGVSIASTLKMTKGGDISSASPLVIDTDGNYFDVTGTTSFAAMTVESGSFFMLQFDGALTITHGSGIELPGAANLTTATGDRLMCYATAANTVEVMSVATEAAAAGGAATLLATVTASGATTVDFTANIDSTYDVYKVVGHSIQPANNIQDLYCRLGDGSGFDSGSTDYKWVVSGAGDASGGNADDTKCADNGGDPEINMGGTTAIGIGGADGDGTAENAAFTLYLYAPSGTTFNTLVGGQVNWNTSSGSAPSMSNFMGSRMTTGAMNRIQFLVSSGNISGVFRLYGLNNS